MSSTHHRQPPPVYGAHARTSPVFASLLSGPGKSAFAVFPRPTAARSATPLSQLIHVASQYSALRLAAQKSAVAPSSVPCSSPSGGPRDPANVPKGSVFLLHLASLEKDTHQKPKQTKTDYTHTQHNAAKLIQRCIRKALLRRRFARLVSTAKIVKILNALEHVMSIPTHNTPTHSTTTEDIMNLEALSLSAISVSSTTESNNLNASSYTTTTSPQRVPSHSHLLHLSPTPAPTFSPLSSPRLIPTLSQLHAQATALSSLISQVETVPSTSPRVEKMKQSTIALIERYRECLLDHRTPASAVPMDAHQLHLESVQITRGSVSTSSRGGGDSSTTHTTHSPPLSTAAQETGSNHAAATDDSVTSSLRVTSLDLDRLIQIRRMEYALMQSIYGVGHGFSGASGVSHAVVTTDRETAGGGGGGGDLAADSILGDIYNESRGGGPGSRLEYGGYRSRASSTVASLYEVTLETDDFGSPSARGGPSGPSGSSGVGGMVGSGVLKRCCVRGLCKRGAGGVGCRNDDCFSESEAGSDVWEII
ncbi:hypothetical protein HDU98_002249 [Podochytrium sp. JEL0797]|nr:hypothetical protein HDU98_002249 [Podochytrium sp. JEL0797]